MLDKSFYEETYKQFLDTYGEEFVLRMCIEEMSELTQAICKYLRIKQCDEYAGKLNQIKQNVIEECADVLICASEVKQIFGEAEVEKTMDIKIQRGRERNEQRKKHLNLLGAKNEEERF